MTIRCTTNKIAIESLDNNNGGTLINTGVSSQLKQVNYKLIKPSHTDATANTIIETITKAVDSLKE